MWSRAPLLVCLGLFAASGVAQAGPVTVLHKEGLVHGFLEVSDLAGARVGDGELLQTARGDRVTSRLVLRFKDGSLYDETSLFSQSGQFRLLSNHLVEKGPSFPRTIDLSIDCRTGRVVVRSTEKDGKQKVFDQQMELPADLANGVVPILLKNVGTSAPPTMTQLVATPKPRLVKLNATADGDDAFRTGGWARKATRFKLKIDLGGVAAAVAPLVGKQPPDVQVWILGGDVPAFVKAEEQLFPDGPTWRLELTSPVWGR